MKKFAYVPLGIALLVFACVPVHAATQNGALDAKAPIASGACSPFSSSSSSLAASGKVRQKDKVPSKNPDDQQITSAMDLFGADFAQMTATSVRMPMRYSEGFHSGAEYQDYLAHSGQFGRGSASIQRTCASTSVVPSIGP